jgi:hypothetical protein
VVDLSIAEGKLTLHIRGADKLWAFKSNLEIPLVHIAGVRADPETAHGWYHHHGGNLLSGWKASLLGRASPREDHRDRSA